MDALSILKVFEKKQKKKLYDARRRIEKSELIKAQKAKFCKTPAGRAMQKRNREKTKDYHLEYCRSPEYKNWKRSYDRVHRAKFYHGQFWECMLLIDEIEKEVIKRVPDKYERLKMRGVIDRCIARRSLKRHLQLGWAYNWSHILSLRNLKTGS